MTFCVDRICWHHLSFASSSIVMMFSATAVAAVTDRAPVIEATSANSTYCNTDFWRVNPSWSPSSEGSLIPGCRDHLLLAHHGALGASAAEGALGASPSCAPAQPCGGGRRDSHLCGCTPLPWGCYDPV